MKGQEPKPSEFRDEYIDEYFRTEHETIIRLLSSVGLENISAYRTDHWYIGHDGTNVLRRYYKADFKGEKVFAKLAYNDDTSCNEIFVNRYLTEHGVPFIPRTLYSEYTFRPNVSLLVTELVPGAHDVSAPQTEAELDDLCTQYSEMLDRLCLLGVTHNDISESNLMRDENGILLMTDFGIASAPGSEVFDINYVIHDGTYYDERDKVRTYDDALSFVRMIDDFPDLLQEWKSCVGYQKICERIGKNEKIVLLP